MFDRKEGFSLGFIFTLMTVGFFGLLFSSIIDCLFFKGNAAARPKSLTGMYIFFVFVDIFTLLVLVPVQILYFRRKNRNDAELPKATFKDLLCLPFGACEPDAKLPKWIALPVLGFFWVLAAVFVIVILLVLLSLIIFKFFPGQPS